MRGEWIAWSGSSAFEARAVPWGATSAYGSLVHVDADLLFVRLVEDGDRLRTLDELDPRPVGIDRVQDLRPVPGTFLGQADWFGDDTNLGLAQSGVHRVDVVDLKTDVGGSWVPQRLGDRRPGRMEELDQLERHAVAEIHVGPAHTNAIQAHHQRELSVVRFPASGDAEPEHVRVERDRRVEIAARDRHMIEARHLHALGDPVRSPSLRKVSSVDHEIGSCHER